MRPSSQLSIFFSTLWLSLVGLSILFIYTPVSVLSAPLLNNQPNGSVISATQNNNGVWGPGVITATNDVTINANITIAANTTILLYPDVTITVGSSGNLTSNGPVKFTSIHASPTLAEHWKGIIFSPNSQGALNQATVEYAQQAITLNTTNPIVIENSILRDNRHEPASGSAFGAGLYIVQGNHRIINTEIYNNQVVSQDDIAYGAGVALEDGSSEISHSAIHHNTVEVQAQAFVYGAGIAIRGDDAPLIQNNEINHNQITALQTYFPKFSHGGGVAIWGETEAKILNNEIAYNINYAGISAGGGVGLAKHATIDLLDSNIIHSNLAQSDGLSGHRAIGGGIDNWWNNRGTQSNNLIYNNEARCTDVCIQHNLSGSLGGGAYILGYIKFVNNTVVGNKADRGGGIGYERNVDIDIINNIVANNSANITTGGIYNSFFHTPQTIDYNLLWNNSNGNYGSMRTPPSPANDIIVAPEFRGGSGSLLEQYKLNATSPAINAGTNSSVTTDIDGEIRPDVDKWDIGFDEFVIFEYEKFVSADEVNTGNLLTYTIILTNNYGVDVQVDITDVIPPHTSYNNNVSCTTGSCSYQPDEVVWQGVLAANGGKITLEFGVTTAIDTPDNTIIMNTAEISALDTIIWTNQTNTRVKKTAMTPTPTATSTLSPTATSTAEPTSTPSPTTTNTAEPTSTPSPTATNTAEPTSTPSPTLTNTAEPTNTPSPTATSTAEPTSTPSPTITSTAEPTNTPSPTLTNIAEPTNTPSPTATNTAESTNTPSPTVTNTAEPTSTPSPITTSTPTTRPTTTPTTVVGQIPPNLAINIMVEAPSEVTLGTIITYTITLINQGTSTVRDISLQDAIPNGVSFNRWGLQPAGSQLSNGQVRWNGSLAPNQQMRLSFAVVVVPGYGRTIDNTVLVETDTNSYSNTTSLLTVSPSPTSTAVPPYNPDFVAQDDNYKVIKNQTLTASTVTENDSHIAAPITATLLTQPLSGTLIFDAAGTFIYRPDPNFVGLDQFDYQIINTVGNVATATVTLKVYQAAELGLSLVSQPRPAIPGQPITYTLVITNNGPSAVSQAVVQNIIPAELIEPTWRCIAHTSNALCQTDIVTNSHQLSDTVRLPIQGAITYTIVATVNPTALGSLTSQAIINAPNGVVDLKPENNQAIDIVPLQPMIALQIRKQFTVTNLKLTGQQAENLRPGQQVTYTLHYTNNGPSLARQVIITDVIPRWLQQLNITSSAIGPQVISQTSCCAITYSWYSIMLHPNEGGVITISGIVSPDLAHDTTFTSTATINTELLADDYWPSQLAFTSSTTITRPIIEEETVDNQAKLWLTTRLPRLSFSQPSYQISEANRSVPISLTLDVSPLVTVTATYDTQDGSATQGLDYTQVAGQIIFPPGTTLLHYQLPISDDKLVEPTESISLSLSQPTRAVLSQPFTATMLIIDSEPLLTVSLKADRAVAYPNEVLTFTYRVTNIGNMNLSGVTVANIQKQAILTALASLDVGETIAGQFTDTIGITKTSKIISQTILAAHSPTVSATANATITLETVVVGPSTVADIAVRQIVSNDLVEPNQPLTYTIVISNLGPGNAKNLIITDTLPETANLVAVSGSCTHQQLLRCDLAELSSGEVATITVVITSTVSGLLTNTVELTSIMPDPQLINNHSQISSLVGYVAFQVSMQNSLEEIAEIDSGRPPVPFEGLQQQLPTSPVGVPITYTIVVTNVGNVTAYNTSLTSHLSEIGYWHQLEGICRRGASNASVCDLGDMKPLDRITITLQVIATQPGLLLNSSSTVATNSDPVLKDQTIEIVGTTTSADIFIPIFMGP